MCRGRCRGRCKNRVGLHFAKKKVQIQKIFYQNIEHAIRLCFYNVPYTVPYTSPKRPLHVPYVPYKRPMFSNISFAGDAVAPPRQPFHRQACELHWRTTDSEAQHHFLQYSTRAFAWAAVHFGFNRGLRAATGMPSRLKDRLSVARCNASG